VSSERPAPSKPSGCPCAPGFPPASGIGFAGSSFSAMAIGAALLAVFLFPFLAGMGRRVSPQATEPRAAPFLDRPERPG
jgi:hypothetical protein